VRAPRQGRMITLAQRSMRMESGETGDPCAARAPAGVR
jgi:hypothetical protein